MSASETAGVSFCPRCGRTHQELEFRPLQQPIRSSGGELVYTHWSTCPTTSEPIMMRVVARRRDKHCFIEPARMNYVTSEAAGRRGE